MCGACNGRARGTRKTDPGPIIRMFYNKKDIYIFFFAFLKSDESFRNALDNRTSDACAFARESYARTATNVSRCVIYARDSSGTVVKEWPAR